MPVIDPQGLFDGDRLSSCSDRAKLFWPFLYCASNGFARLEMNLTQIRKKCFSGFMHPPQDGDILDVLKEYAENFLILMYTFEGKQWLQFDTDKKYLPRHKSKKDEASPSPAESSLLEFTEGYINWKQAKSLNLQLVRKISENFGKIRENCHGIGIGGGIGIGVGGGVGSPDPTQNFPENGQEEEWMKVEKEIATSCQQILRVKADLYPDQIAQLKFRAQKTSNGQVLREFEEWALENVHEDFRGRPISAFLRSLDNPVISESKQAAEDPQVQAIVRELAYRSDNAVSFDNKSKAGFAKLFKDGFTFDEIVGVFKNDYFPRVQDDPYKLRNAGQNFPQEADQLIYTVRRKKHEKEEENIAILRKAAAMQEVAEAERKARKEKQAEEELMIEDELGD